MTSNDLDFEPEGKEPSFSKKLGTNVGYAGKKFTGELIGGFGSLAELIGKIPYLGGGAKAISTILPKVEGVEKGYEKVLGRKFEPTGMISEILGEAARFAGGLISFGGMPRAATTAGRIGRGLVATGLPAAASVLTKKGKLPPWAQAAATIGTSLAAHKLTGLDARQIERGLYREARTSAGNATINARQGIRGTGGARGLPSFESELRTMRNEILRGGTSSVYKDPTLKHINDLLNSIHRNKGNMSIQELLAFRENINTTRGTLFKRAMSGEVNAPKAKRLINNLNGSLDNFLNRYQNPEFQRAYRTANSIHKGRMDTRKIYEFLSSHAFNKTYSSGVGLGLAYSMINGSIGTIAGKAAPAAAIAQAGAWANAMAKNPGLRYAFREFLRSASREELKATGKALNNLGIEAKKAKLDISQFEDVGFSPEE